MDIVRNFIHVLGLTPPNELPEVIKGQIVQHGDVEIINIPENSVPVKNLFQIMIQAKITSTRRIDVPLGTIVIIDGFKDFKILYSEGGNSSKANMAAFKVPYNTFIELPDKDTAIEKINIHLLDGYFELLDSRRIYSYITYLLDIEYKGNNTKGGFTKVDYKPEWEDTFNMKSSGDNSLERFYINGEEISSSVKEPVENESSKINMEKEAEAANITIDIDSEYL